MLAAMELQMPALMIILLNSYRQVNVQVQQVVIHLHVVRVLVLVLMEFIHPQV